MSIFTIQSHVGGFLDEELTRYNRVFDDWCVQFEYLEDAQLIFDTLPNQKQIEIIEIIPLSYPKYFFHKLKGNVHATRQIENKIICIVEPFVDSSFRIAVCNLDTKDVTLTTKRYRNSLNAEAAFANFLLL
ncbi:MAG TPA: hypothetical protein EYO73_12815 [Sulfurimonas sp.]|nr:hypothetical protein [Sulfurimonas sp.]